HELAERILPVHRHEACPRLVVRGMERDCEPDLTRKVRPEPPDLGNEPGGTHRYPSPRHVHSPRVREQPKAPRRRVVIKEWYSHPQEHDVAKVLLTLEHAQPEKTLRNDLVRAEVPLEACDAARAEHASHRAPDLRRDALRDPVARAHLRA